MTIYCRLLVGRHSLSSKVAKKAKPLLKVLRVLKVSRNIVLFIDIKW